MRKIRRQNFISFLQTKIDIDDSFIIVSLRPRKINNTTEVNPMYYAPVIVKSKYECRKENYITLGKEILFTCRILIFVPLPKCNFTNL